MHPTPLLLSLLALLTPSTLALATTIVDRSVSTANQVCVELAKALPGVVFLAGTADYIALSTQYYYGGTVSQSPACLVEPSTPQHVSTIIKAVGAKRVPWAVFGGGHSANKGFSTTSGVQISMKKFSAIKYSASAGTVEVGPGLIWNDVYNALNNTGQTVLGARGAGPGVSGVSLGGGWAFQTQEYGLVIDRIVAIELVSPKGNILTVTAQSNPDLFWALRGGGNQFGIATKFTYRTIPSPNIYAGNVAIGGDGNKTLVSEATEVFATWQAQNKDPKALVMGLVIFTSTAPPVVEFLVFYNGPTPPKGTFDLIEKYPKLSDTRKANIKFADYMNAQVYPHTSRGNAEGVPVKKYSSTFVQGALQAGYDFVAASAGKSFESLYVIYEPYLDVWASHSNGGAYPHSTSQSATGFELSVAYTAANDDSFFQTLIMSTFNKLNTLAVKNGDADSASPMYSGYANYAQPVSSIFQQNLPRLCAIQNAKDPDGVMDLTTWFDIDGHH